MRAEIVISAQRHLNMRRDSSFCAKSVRCNIFTNGAPYPFLLSLVHMRTFWCTASGAAVL